jgi:hypothetical protein
VTDLHATRRGLLFALGGLSANAWLASIWPQIAAAADHAANTAATVPTTFVFFNTVDGADVDAIAARILPGGRGERE